MRETKKVVKVKIAGYKKSMKKIRKMKKALKELIELSKNTLS